MDFGIETVTQFDELACYGRVWLVEFRDYSQAIIVENWDEGLMGDSGNFILEPEEE